MMSGCCSPVITSIARLALDTENAILIHDPQHQLGAMREKAASDSSAHDVVKHYRDLQSIADYPVKVRKTDSPPEAYPY